MRANQPVPVQPVAQHGIMQIFGAAVFRRGAIVACAVAFYILIQINKGGRDFLVTVAHGRFFYLLVIAAFIVLAVAIHYGAPFLWNAYLNLGAWFYRTVRQPILNSPAGPYIVRIENFIINLILASRDFLILVWRNKAEVGFLSSSLVVAWIVSTVVFATPPCRIGMGEEAPWDEKSARTSLLAMAEFAQDRYNRQPHLISRRNQHALSISCVRANFTVLEPEKGFSHGLFSSEFANKTFPAWIRFSHGSSEIVSDLAAGPRGLSLKVLNVSLPRDFNDEPSSFDMLFISSPIFFSADPSQYAQLIEAFLTETIPLWIAQNIFSRGVWRSLFSLARIIYDSSCIEQLLDVNWFSTVPYRWGRKSAVKYALQPCNLTTQLNCSFSCSPGSDSCLRDALAHALVDCKISGCFNLLVQRQEHPCREPIEDPTIEWLTTFHKVAKVEIPPQEFRYESQYEFCESLSFTPWHAPDAHKPLGAVNHHRLSVYTEMANLRRKFNLVPHLINQTELSGRETFKGPLVHEADKLLKEDIERDKRPRGDVENFQFRKYDLHYETIPPDMRHYGDYMPAFSPKLVRESQFSTEETLRVLGQVIVGLTNRLSVGTNQEALNLKNPNDYVKLLSDNGLKSRLPWLARNRLWEQDQVFAAQWLRGINPMSIIRILPKDPLPGALDLLPKHVDYLERFVLSNITVRQLHAEGRLLYADYAELKKIPIKKGNVCYPAIILFYIEKNGTRFEMMPLAIQLEQTKDDDEIFLPPERDVLRLPTAIRDSNTHWLTWLFARMHVASSDAQIHEMVSHLGTTHLLLEPIIISAYRQFPKSHPIFLLLKPHMRQTIAINELGRRTLLNEGGLFDTLTAGGRDGTLLLIAVACKSLNFTDRAFPKEMRSRGFEEVSDPGGASDPVPGYLYRDYGFLIWKALSKYVNIIVSRHYDSDDAVKKDRSLQRFFEEASDPNRGNVRGFPKSVESIDVLSEILTTFIFTASAQHSAVNFGQFDFYGFIPNKPMRLTKAMPKNAHDQINMAYIMSALPDISTSLAQITITNVLSLKPSVVLELAGEENESVFLSSLIKDGLELGDEMWRPHFVEEWRDLIADLAESQLVMKQRNQFYGYQYDYLYYDEIAMSISI